MFLINMLRLATYVNVINVNLAFRERYGPASNPHSQLRRALDPRPLSWLADVPIALGSMATVRCASFLGKVLESIDCAPAY